MVTTDRVRWRLACFPVIGSSTVHIYLGQWYTHAGTHTHTYTVTHTATYTRKHVHIYSYMNIFLNLRNADKHKLSHAYTCL